MGTVGRAVGGSVPGVGAATINYKLNKYQC